MILLILIQYNTISKIHFNWIKNINKYSLVDEIQKAMLWLNVQKLRKTINKNAPNIKELIEDWSMSSISRDAIYYSILLYNSLNIDQIKSDKSNYNICYKYIYPSILPQGHPSYEQYYKNYPIIPKKINIYTRFTGCPHMEKK